MIFDSRRTGTGTRRRAGYKRRMWFWTETGLPGYFRRTRGAEGAPGFATRERQYEQIIEAEGLAAAPGLVDVHVHFRDPGGPRTRRTSIQGAGLQQRAASPRSCAWPIPTPLWITRRTLRYMCWRREKDRHPCVKLRRCVKGICRQGLTDMEGLLAARAARFTDDRIPLMEGRLSGRPWRKRPDWIRFSASMRGRTSILSGKMESNHGRISDELGIYGSPALAEIPWWPGTA